MKSSANVQSTAAAADTDAAIAAAELLKKLDNGYYMDRGKRRKINGDDSKLIFAENLSKLQGKLLADFRFRCSALPRHWRSGKDWPPGILGISGLWEWHFHHNLSNERHNYLALRLS